MPWTPERYSIVCEWPRIELPNYNRNPRAALDIWEDCLLKHIGLYGLKSRTPSKTSLYDSHKGNISMPNYTFLCTISP